MSIDIVLIGIVSTNCACRIWYCADLTVVFFWGGGGGGSRKAAL